jgi:hypothetical protein
MNGRRARGSAASSSATYGLATRFMASTSLAEQVAGEPKPGGQPAMDERPAGAKAKQAAHREAAPAPKHTARTLGRGGKPRPQGTPRTLP